nr:MAG TPA: hypothetical protein [Caudoviricetes sp.]
MILPFNRNQSGYLYIHDMLQSHNIELHGRVFTYEFPQEVGCNLHIL